MNSAIKIYEPWFFVFFGIFHLHRIWGLIDRAAYSKFWLTILEQKGIFYYSIMGVLVLLCLMGIFTFFRNIHHNPWWRWIYLLGGGYVPFDLFCIALELEFWRRLLLAMFNTSAPYWNLLWSTFIIMGAACLIWGIVLFSKRKACPS